MYIDTRRNCNMDLTTAVTSLGNDYVNKVSDLLTNNSVTSTNTSQDSTFDSIFNSVSGLLDSTNNYIQQAQQAEVDFCTWQYDEYPRTWSIPAAGEHCTSVYGCNKR